jgi:hypothetical protein
MFASRRLARKTRDTVFDAFVTFDPQGIAHFQWIGSDVEAFAFKKCMAAHGMVITEGVSIR